MKIILLVFVGFVCCNRVNAQAAPTIEPVMHYDKRMGLRYYFPTVVEDSVAFIIRHDLKDLKSHSIYLSIDTDCDTAVLVGYRYRKNTKSKELRRYLKVFKRYVDIAGYKLPIASKDDYRFGDPGFGFSHYYFKIRFVGKSFERGAIL